MVAMGWHGGRVFMAPPPELSQPWNRSPPVWAETSSATGPTPGAQSYSPTSNCPEHFQLLLPLKFIVLSSRAVVL